MNCPLSVPVSRPVLTFSVPGAQALTGDVVELRCGQGSISPHLYGFTIENVPLGNTAALLWRRASFQRPICDRKAFWGPMLARPTTALRLKREREARLLVTGRKSPKPPSRDTGCRYSKQWLVSFPWVSSPSRNRSSTKEAVSSPVSFLAGLVHIIITGLPVSFHHQIGVK